LIGVSLNGKKGRTHWETIVGYTLNDLKNHLEKQFKSRMTWKNYGRYWHIDHRIPVTKFNFDSYNDIGFKECWALDNLQPLTARKNISKGNRYSEPTIKQITENNFRNTKS